MTPRTTAAIAWRDGTLRPLRAPPDKIPAPPIPAQLQWLNVASLRMDKQLGRPVLIEFWDFCRAHSLRAQPYISAWHERYAAAGLRVISVHAGGYEPSRDPAQIAAAVARLGIEHPVVIDREFELWQLFGNAGWPARYLFDPRLYLHSYHYGEGAYAQTEEEICALLQLDCEPLAPLRPGDAPGAVLAAHSAEQPGAWSGDYEAGGVWAVLDGNGSVTANGLRFAVRYPGCFELVEHERHTAAELRLSIGPGVRCHAVQFTPGLTG